MASISDRLQKKAEIKGSKKIQFIALKKEISKALSDGYSGRSIWQLLQENNEINMSYQMFRTYMNMLIFTENQGKITKKYDLNIPSKNKKVDQKALLEEVRKRQEEEREKEKFYHPSTPRSIEELVG